MRTTSARWRAELSCSGFIETVTSGLRLAATSRSMACCMTGGTAKMPTLATASASVRTVKNVRALRRVKSVTDLRTMADMSASSRGDDAVADGDRAVRLRGELAVVGHVEDRRPLG